DVSSLNQAKAISLSKGVAWHTITGKDLALTADYSQVKKQVGVYDLTLKTAKNTSITVKVNVVADAMIVQTGLDFNSPLLITILLGLVITTYGYSKVRKEF
ncbi:MAG: hypothetical protein ACRCTA_00290, partial [Bacilli bacterium]